MINDTVQEIAKMSEEDIEREMISAIGLINAFNRSKKKSQNALNGSQTPCKLYLHLDNGLVLEKETEEGYEEAESHYLGKAVEYQEGQATRTAICRKIAFV